MKALDSCTKTLVEANLSIWILVALCPWHLTTSPWAFILIHTEVSKIASAVDNSLYSTSVRRGRIPRSHHASNWICYFYSMGNCTSNLWASNASSFSIKSRGIILNLKVSALTPWSTFTTFIYSQNCWSWKASFEIM